MASTATVAARPRVRWLATMPPAMSICESSQPPKISPLGLVSAGMATVWMASRPLGSDDIWAMVMFSDAATCCYYYL